MPQLFLSVLNIFSGLQSNLLRDTWTLIFMVSGNVFGTLLNWSRVYIITYIHEHAHIYYIGIVFYIIRVAFDLVVIYIILIYYLAF
jgi:hypothetical protein